jgi:putative nucleotidyltransferase with HDIG domain
MFQTSQGKLFAGRAVLILGSLVFVTGIVYATGGTHTVTPQLMYLPIAVAAWFFRANGGLITGVVAGLMIGPAMPLDVAAGIDQDMTNWIVRLGIFAFLGFTLGVGSDSRLNQLSDLRRLNDESIRAFVHTIDAKSKHTAQHSESVARYSVLIGIELGLNWDQLDRLRWEGLLHDIGKLTIPDEILNKPGPLDNGEWKIIRQHPLESVRMLQGVNHYQQYLDAIRHHHERYDGGGYPAQLSGTEIPRDARIMAVADCYDAMTSARPYRNAFSHQEAFDVILAESGKQFDPDIVDAFARSFAPVVVEREIVTSGEMPEAVLT